MMLTQKPFLAGILLTVFGFTACNSSEIGDSRDVNQDKIYLDYRINYTEGDENVKLSFQYRFAGSAGTTLVLSNTSKVELDGEKLKVDSSESEGAFYDVEKPLKSFSGKHRITFTDLNGRYFENSFEFAPFALQNLPVYADPNKDLIVYFSSLPLNTDDYVEISTVNTDSSFQHQQIAANGSITIPASDLIRQKEKMLSWETVLYRNIPLSQITPEGGKLTLFYRLKPVKIKLRS